MKKTLKQNSPIICFEQLRNGFDNFGKELSSPTINFLKDNEYIFYYDSLTSRDWRFFNYHYPFVKDIIKLAPWDLPKRPNLKPKTRVDFNEEESGIFDENNFETSLLNLEKLLILIILIKVINKVLISAVGIFYFVYDFLTPVI